MIPRLSPFASILASLALSGAFPLWAQQCDAGVSFSGPIVITEGGTYSGNWQSTDPKVPAVTVLATALVTIVNSRLRGPGDLLRSYVAELSYPAVNLVVRQSCFVGTNPNILGVSKGTPISLFEPVSVLVEFCDFESTGSHGVYVNGYRGNYTASNTIKFLQNRFRNIDARYSDGRGGYLKVSRSDRAVDNSADAMQLDHVQGVPGIEIAWNQIINEPDQSAVADTISVYASSGTPASPIRIHDNFVRGNYAADPVNADGLQYTGSGINTNGRFETNPDRAAAHVKIHDNQVVSFGFEGIGVSSGHDIEVYSNRVISSGLSSDGANISRPPSLGIKHQNVYRSPAGVFGGNSIHDNLSGLRARTREGTWLRNDYSFSDPPAVSYNNAPWAPATSDSPTLTDEANEFLLWNEKLLANGMKVGSNLVAPPLSGRLLVVSGNSQLGNPGSLLGSPIAVRAVNTTGFPVGGVNVAFTVTTANASARQHFAITDLNGLASTGIVLGTGTAGVRVEVIAAGYTGATFNLWISQPAAVVRSGGIAGVGGSVPAVQSLSPNALFSIFGQNFLPAGVAGRRVLASEFVDGGLPFTLLGVCVDVGGQRAAILDVFPTQINAQAPAMMGGNVDVRVLTNCGTPAEIGSSPQSASVAVASPEFLYFQLNADGRNPVALANAVTGALVGPANLLGGRLSPARPGDILTAYATGFGPLRPALATGQIPAGTAAALGPVSVTIGGVALAPTDILYAGAAPGQVINQLNFRIPMGAADGNQALRIFIGGIGSPPNAFVTIQR